jgi:hypothetical protein
MKRQVKNKGFKRKRAWSTSEERWLNYTEKATVFTQEIRSAQLRTDIE